MLRKFLGDRDGPPETSRESAKRDVSNWVEHNGVSFHSFTIIFLLSPEVNGYGTSVPKNKIIEVGFKLNFLTGSTQIEGASLWLNPSAALTEEDLLA